MPVTVESLLLLAEGKMKETEKRELQNASQHAIDTAAHLAAMLRDVFPKSTWEALGLNPSSPQFGTYDSYETSLCHDFEITAREWVIPMRFVVKHRVVLYINDHSLLLSSGHEYHAENTSNLSALLLKVVGLLPIHRESAINDFHVTVERAESELDLDALNGAVAAADSIPGLTQAMRQELIYRADQARTYISTTLYKRMKAADRLFSLAKFYFNDLAVYDEACRRWAEENTANLWKPWMLWRVRYAPSTNGSALPPNALLDEVYTDAQPEKVRQSLCCRSVNLDGTVTDRFHIGSFFSAQPYYFNEPAITSSIPFHVQHRCGKFVFNAPALSAYIPSPFVFDAPPSWPEYVRSHFKELVLFSDLTAEAVLEMPASDLAKRIVFTAEVLS